MKYVSKVGEEQYVIDIDHAGEIIIDGEIIDSDIQQMPDTSMYSILIDGKSHDVRLMEGDGAYLVQIGGAIFEVVVEDERTRRLAGLRRVADSSGEVLIKAPMSGVVVEIPVEEGQDVAEGDIVVILESMKMQNEFKAPREGTVRAVRVEIGQTVDQNAVLVTIA